MRKYLAGISGLFLLLAVADWFALRSRPDLHPPWVLAALVAATIGLMTGRSIQLVCNLRKKQPQRGRTAAELILLSGLLTALLGGMANWMLGFQGFVILSEGDTVPLHGVSHLQGFEAGPLARLDEMGMALALDEVKLIPSGSGFYPRSNLRFWESEKELVRLEVAVGQSDEQGAVRFFQGAFGFSPRIVIIKGKEMIFDHVVPFTTELQGRSGISFQGLFNLESEDLEVSGVVDLASMDEGMRGHATLGLTLSRDGIILGQGDLLPGHFAEIAEGYRVGFAGLERWSEIDISRRNYGWVVQAGAVLFLLGAIFWAVAWLRSR